MKASDAEELGRLSWRWIFCLYACRSRKFMIQSAASGSQENCAGMIGWIKNRAPVAQLDRAIGFEPIGRGFESLRARQKLTRVPRHIPHIGRMGVLRRL